MRKTPTLDKIPSSKCNRLAQWRNFAGVRHADIISLVQHRQLIHAFTSGIFVGRICHKPRSAIIKVLRIVTHRKSHPRFSLSLSDSIGDFIWRANSDNLLSVGRDEQLVHANISTAIKTEQFESLFSLNVTSKGHVCAAMPNIDDDYVRALYAEHQVPVSPTSFKKFYLQETMAAFVKWNKPIRGKSIVGIYSNTSHDNSVESFHQFARRWTFGNSDKSSEALASVCDVNSFVAEQLKRPDLKATWEVIKMIYADYDGLQNYRALSSRRTPSANKTHHVNESASAHRYHHHYQQTGGKSHHTDSKQQQQQQQQDFESSDDSAVRKRLKSQEPMSPANTQMGE